MARHGLRSLAGAATVVFLLAGCGGSSSAGGTQAARGEGDPALKVAQCMRAHGVPNFPDPAPGGGLVVPNSINVKAPAFEAAQHACANLFPGGGPSGRASEADKLAMLHLARCIRTHGVPDFPDPTTAPPATPPANGLALGRGGVFLIVRDPQAPAFKHAAAVCGFPRPH
jgi:hypothetical protein